jgi:predicted membrane GTPase involved in stress response
MCVSTAGAKNCLLPHYRLACEQAIEYINDDKCMEVTLQRLHVRQRILVANMRPKRQE